MSILTGIKGLLRSTKGTLCLLILALTWQILLCATFLSFKQVIDGTVFAAVIGVLATIVGTIGSIYMWTRCRANLAKINKEL